MKRFKAILMVLLLSGAALDAQSVATLRDFSDSPFNIPANVSKVSCIHPIFTYMTWRLAPEKLVSVDKVFVSQYLAENSFNVFSDADAARLKSLPVTGVFFSGIDPEQILGLGSQILVTISTDVNIAKLRTQLSLPVLVLSKSRIQDYEQSFRLLGQAIGAQAEANKLADYWKSTLDKYQKRLATGSSAKKPVVFHIAAGGIYSAVGEKTIMASIVELSGGQNASQDLAGNPLQESIPVSFEQIAVWNPDVIVTQNDAQRTQILSDPAWSKLNAVKAKRVYAQLKYARVDGVSALNALAWYDMILNHPDDKAALDAYYASEKEFFRLFYKYEITPAQMAELQK